MNDKRRMENIGKMNSGKFCKLKYDTKYQNNSFYIIVQFFDLKERACVLPLLNSEFKAYFLYEQLVYKPRILSYIKKLKNKYASLEEFKCLIENHAQIKSQFSKNEDLFLYRSIYIYPFYLFDKLATLDLQKLNIGYDGIMILNYYLKNTTTLINLNLSYNNIQNRGMFFLEYPLKINKSIQFISLECNNIKNKGFISLANALSIHSQIKIIKLALNSITIEGLLSFTSIIGASNSMKCPNLKIVDLKYNNIILTNNNISLFTTYSYIKA